MNFRIRAVVFDLDGTLVDSMPLVLRAYAHALEPYLPEITADELRRSMGGPPERIFERLLTDPTRIAGALERLVEFGATNWRLIQPFPGMIKLMDDLRGAGRRVGVWTGRERNSTVQILRQSQIADKIDVCVCGDDLGSHKPDPAGLADTLRRLSVEPPEALFVGDAEVDLLAGIALGVPTLLISHGYAVTAELAGRAWKVAETPEAAYAFVRDTVNWA